jgi:hypothetical protein
LRAAGGGRTMGREGSRQMEQEVKATGDIRQARAVVHYDPATTDAGEMSGVIDNVCSWLKGETPVLLIPPDVRVDVYGIPKAGGSGLAYEVQSGDARVRYEAPDLNALTRLVAAAEAPVVKCNMTAEQKGEIRKALESAANTGGEFMTVPMSKGLFDKFKDKIITTEWRGDQFAPPLAPGCICPTADLMVRGCTCWSG